MRAMKRLILYIVTTCCFFQLSSMKRVYDDDIEKSVMLFKRFKLSDDLLHNPMQQPTSLKRPRTFHTTLPRSKKIRLHETNRKRMRIESLASDRDIKRLCVYKSIWDIFKQPVKVKYKQLIGLDPNELQHISVHGQIIYFTPLNYAISEQEEDLVKVLLQAGASPNLASQKAHETMVSVAHIESESPLSLAIKLNHLAIIRLLLDYGAYVGASEQAHARCYANEAVRELLQ